MKYCFFLGATSELCLAELQAVSSRWKKGDPTVLVPGLAVIEFAQPLSEHEVLAWQNTLGGTAKIGILLSELPLTAKDTVLDVVSELLIPMEPKRFIISEVGRDHLPPLDTITIKNRLQAAGLKSHYKEAPRHGAAAALLHHHNVTELTVWQTAEQIFIIQTVSAQDVRGWTQRDMNKPVRDRQRGMLPPKVARMMVNLALTNQDPQTAVVLDPFCGTGTVLMEAAELGVPTVYAADLAAEAVAQTKTNLDWYQTITDTKLKTAFTIKSATELVLRDWDKAPTAIVTEPFLGKLTPNPEQIPNIVRGLDKLYRGALRAFAHLLQPGQRIVIIFPSFVVGRHTLGMNRLLADLPQLGFRVVAGPMVGGHPGAITQRHIFVLEYEPYGTR
jgi:tRNA G10  N-methylase Trm11